MPTDSDRVGRTFARHFAQYDTSAIVQRTIAEQLDADLGTHCPTLTVHRALEIGIGTGFLTRLVTARYPHAEWYFNDLTPAAFDWIPAGLRQAIPLPGDAESIRYPGGLDLIASASALQWFDNLAAFFHKARRVLNPGGILAVATFSDGHFLELAHIAPAPIQYPTVDEIQNMVKAAGLTLLHTRTLTETLHFDSARSLLSHLRCTGVNGRSTASIRTPSQLSAFETHYREVNGRRTTAPLPLTYKPILLIART